MTPPPTSLHTLANLYLVGRTDEVRQFLDALPPDRILACYKALKKPVEDEMFRRVAGLDMYWVALAAIHDYVEVKVRHHYGHRYFENEFIQTVI